MGWAKFDDQFTDHPKVVAAGPMAELLAMRAVIHCARYETDGHVQAAQLPRLALGIPSARKHAQLLVDVGMWDLDPDGDGWWVHDFLDYHPSREEQQVKREQARERMAKNRAKKEPPGSPERARDVRANTTRSHAGRSPYPDPTRPQPDVPDGTSTSTTSDLRPDPAVSHDAQQLTRQFAEAVKANGHPMPGRGSKARDDWLVEMDRLLRLGPPGEGGHIPQPDEVSAVIAWCAADKGSGSYPGESVTVRSVPKFRQRYSELRAKALNGQPKGMAYAGRYRQAADQLREAGR